MGCVGRAIARPASRPTGEAPSPAGCRLSLLRERKGTCRADTVNDQQVRTTCDFGGPPAGDRSAKAGCRSPPRAGSSVIRRPPSTKPASRPYRTRATRLPDLWDDGDRPLCAGSPGTAPDHLAGGVGAADPGRVSASPAAHAGTAGGGWNSPARPRSRRHLPGKPSSPAAWACADFTDASRLGVTIAGSPFDHRLYHFALAYSGVEHAEVGAGRRELSRPGQRARRALRLLGCAPREHRSDSTVGRISQSRPARCPRVLTRRYEALATHFGMVTNR